MNKNKKVDQWRLADLLKVYPFKWKLNTQIKSDPANKITKKKVG